MTPHQQAKYAAAAENTPQVGDAGIWVTCARHQENKAAREIAALFEEYAEKMYGVAPPVDPATGPDGGDEDDEDIEAAIKKEIADFKAKPSADEAREAKEKQVFAIMKMNVDCLLFVKTKAPIEPVEFVRRICQDIRDAQDPSKIKCRYVNRLTPSTVLGKATEQGIVDLAREVLGETLDLSGKKETAAAEGEKKEGDSESKPAEEAADAVQVQTGEFKGQDHSFAIRPTVRNHNKLKRDVVINTVAGLINNDRHKVNLSAPDRVVLVDLYQTVCGMSIVGSDWDELKRYNVTELYNQAIKRSTEASKAEE